MRLHAVYSVRFIDCSARDVTAFRLSLEERLYLDGRFVQDEPRLKPTAAGGAVTGYCLELRGVRLKKPLPLVGRRKTVLDEHDWIEFHNILNDVLDERGHEADVWTQVPGTGRRFWIRKGKRRRCRWDSTEDARRSPSWNCDGEDQFAPPPSKKRGTPA